MQFNPCTEQVPWAPPAFQARIGHRTRRWEAETVSSSSRTVQDSDRHADRTARSKIGLGETWCRGGQTNIPRETTGRKPAHCHPSMRDWIPACFSFPNRDRAGLAPCSGSSDLQSAKARGDAESVFDAEQRVRRRLLFQKIQPQIPRRTSFRNAPHSARAVPFLRPKDHFTNGTTPSTAFFGQIRTSPLSVSIRTYRSLPMPSSFIYESWR